MKLFAWQKLFRGQILYRSLVPPIKNGVDADWKWSFQLRDFRKKLSFVLEILFHFFWKLTSNQHRNFSAGQKRPLVDGRLTGILSSHFGKCLFLNQYCKIIDQNDTKKCHAKFFVDTFFFLKFLWFFFTHESHRKTPFSDILFWDFLLGWLWASAMRGLIHLNFARFWPTAAISTIWTWTRIGTIARKWVMFVDWNYFSNLRIFVKFYFHFLETSLIFWKFRWFFKISYIFSKFLWFLKKFVDFLEISLIFKSFAHFWKFLWFFENFVDFLVISFIF